MDALASGDECKQDGRELLVSATRADLSEQSAIWLKPVPISEHLKAFLGNAKGPGSGIVKSTSFQLFTGLIIFGSTCNMVAAQYDVVQRAESGEEVDPIYKLLDIVFCACFTFELIARLVAERFSFFIHADNKSNVADILFVLLDLMAFDPTLNKAVGNVNLFRALRMLRIFRLFRTLKFHNSLRLLISEVMRGVQGLVWLVMIFGIVLLFFSLLFMQATADVVGDSSESKAGVQLLGYFGTLEDAFTSLFQVSVGGANWQYVYADLLEVSRMYAFSFMMYTIFLLFVFLNAVTATFVESAFHTAKFHEKERNDLEAHKMKMALTLADQDGDGTVTRDEFLKHLDSYEMKKTLDVLQLDRAEAVGIFELLDMNQSGVVQLDALTRGCERFTRPVRSVDSVAVLLASRRMVREFHMLREFVVNGFANVGQMLALIAE